MKTLTLNLSFLAQDSQAVSNDPSDSVRINRCIQETFTAANRSFPIQIANGAVQQSIPLPVPLPDSTVDYLILHVDQPVTVFLSGDSTGILLNPQAPGTKTPVLFVRGATTSLSVSNSSGTTANLDVVAVNL